MVVNSSSTPEHAATDKRHNTENDDAWNPAHELQLASQQRLNMCSIAGKGRGILANRTLPSETKLLKDQTVMVFEEAGDTNAALHMLAAQLLLKYPRECAQLYTRLPLRMHKIPAAYARYNFTRHDWSHAIEAVFANGWGCESMREIHPLFSFFNHSCAPNAEIRGDCAFTLRPIMAGEEVTISYVEFEPGMTREERALELQHWGFTCTCTLCAMHGRTPSKVRAKSEHKRRSKKRRHRQHESLESDAVPTEGENVSEDDNGVMQPVAVNRVLYKNGKAQRVVFRENQ